MIDFGTFHVDGNFAAGASPQWAPQAIYGRRGGRWVSVGDALGLCSGQSADDALAKAGYVPASTLGSATLLLAANQTEVTRGWPFAATLGFGGGQGALILMASLPDWLDVLPSLAALAEFRAASGSSGK